MDSEGTDRPSDILMLAKLKSRAFRAGVSTSRHAPRWKGIGRKSSSDSEKAKLRRDDVLWLRFRRGIDVGGHVLARPREVPQCPDPRSCGTLGVTNMGQRCSLGRLLYALIAIRKVGFVEVSQPSFFLSVVK